MAYADHWPPKLDDAQLIMAGERIGYLFDDGIDKARRDESRAVAAVVAAVDAVYFATTLPELYDTMCFNR